MLNTIVSASAKTGKPIMSHRSRILLNIVGFQLGWFACVLSAANGYPLAGSLFALLVVALTIVTSQNKRTTIETIITVSVIGILWDGILTTRGVLVFDIGMLSSYLPPYWIMAMWLLFSTTLNLSLRWLYEHPIIAMILGFIMGPLAYQGGAALGAVNIPNDFSANLVLAFGWAVILPASIMLARLFEKQAKLETRS